MLAEEKFRPAGIGGKLRNPKAQRRVSMTRRRGTPDAPARPRDHRVKRGPNHRKNIVRWSEARLVEFPIPGVAIAIATVARPVPGGAGRGNAENAQSEQRSGIGFRHDPLGESCRTEVACPIPNSISPATST